MARKGDDQYEGPTKAMSVRFSGAQRARAQTAADALGLHVSAFARAAVLDLADQVIEEGQTGSGDASVVLSHIAPAQGVVTAEAVEFRSEVRGLRVDLSKGLGNVNQIARRMNAGQHVEGDEVGLVMRELMVELEGVRALVAQIEESLQPGGGSTWQ